MNADRWANVERLYHEALARPPGGRAPFLADACGGDDASAPRGGVAARSRRRRLLPEHAGAARLTAVAPFTSVNSSVPTSSPDISAPAGWARCTGRATRGSAATSRSRCCRALSSPRSRAAGAIRARSAAARLAQSSAHRARSTASSRRDGVRALVLELVEGPTLADRLAQGAAADRERRWRSRADRRRARSRAREGDRPSRSEAGQHQADARAS